MACKGCPPQNGDCDCPVKDLNTDCSTYIGTLDLPHIGTTPDTILTQILFNINKAFGDLKDSLASYFQLGNVGAGVTIFKGISTLGIRELKSIINGSNINLTSNTNDITIAVPDASTTTKGAVEIATQTEVNSGTDTVKAVTPATLKVYTSAPGNLPIANTTQQGIAEIATQAEVDLGVDLTRIVTPGTLKAYVADEISDEANLPQSTTTQKGVIEIATQAEVDAKSDTSRAVTPSTLSNYVNNELSDPSNLPNATTTQRGVVELSTQTEANALSDSEKAITPATIPIATQTQRGISELATLAEAASLSNTEKPLTPGVMPSAGYSQKGLVELATTVETTTGTDTTRAVTPAGLTAALNNVVTLAYEETEIGTWSEFTPITVPHTLGVRPKLIQVSLRCRTAYDDYAVGDEIEPNYHFQSRPDSPQSFGIAVVKNTSNIHLKIGNSFTVPVTFKQNTGGSDREPVTGSGGIGNFSLIVRVFA